ncbi:MAG: SUMF1/EgtB/PvdO family nonheme iron enzyme [Kiritimatiellae bacterium]|nr:SUMF1/EgtB/PvdO family nonheme iron enzyme [Kiritimatiellia bacterium]
MDNWDEYLDEMEHKATRDGGNVDLVLAERYRIVRKLGQGGMGSVWLAEDTQLDKLRVALKMLPSILVANKRAYNQMKAEALVSLKLSHTNIVMLRAFEENGGNPFLVMDYVDGQTLDDLLAERGTLTETETVALLTPVAAALDYAHTRGVVHRDMKPGNVIIDKEGTPYVLDFGIAREAKDTLTRVTGMLSSGTLSYMSPEQLNGVAPKAAQDIYSFAAMAYECLTGAPPFCRGPIEYQIMNTPPEPLRGDSSLVAGIMAGLAKAPEDRPASCAAVLGIERDGNRTAPVEQEKPVDRIAPDKPQAEDATSPSPTQTHLTGTEENAAKVRVQAKLLERRLQGNVYLNSFAKRKKELDEIMFRAETSFESRIWPDAASLFTEYVKLGEELEQQIEDRKRRERENRVVTEGKPCALYTFTLPGGAEMRFRWCPPGMFTMIDAGCFSVHQHQVTLTKGFWMADALVTQEQWKSVMGNNPSHFKGENLPVEEVSWHDCQKFIQKVNESLDCGMRLPTEAEWEYACRARTTGDYGGTGELNEMGWYENNSEAKTHPVRSKSMNALGLYDMHGNVWEWCADWSGDYPNGSVTDPTGPSIGERRVNRGGSWDSPGCRCRSWSRASDDPNLHDHRIGFRVALSASS